MDRPGRMAAVPSDLRLALPQPGAATGMRLMTIKSMTGFARAEGQHGGLAWHLGVAQRQRPRPRPAPAAAAGLSRRSNRSSARPSAKQLTRGSVTVSLNVQRQQGATQIRINEAGARAGSHGGGPVASTHRLRDAPAPTACLAFERRARGRSRSRRTPTSPTAGAS